MTHLRIKTILYNFGLYKKRLTTIKHYIRPVLYINKTKMKLEKIIFPIIFIITLCSSCSAPESPADLNIIFLHHSTGEFIWNGKPPSLIRKAAGKVSDNLADKISRKPYLLKLFEEHNDISGKNYLIEERDFPKAKPYGWNNFPFDYYNIWVKNAGEEPYKEEPTLEILTKDFKVIIFKHCYPVSNIKPDQDSASIDSYLHTISNYKLQYLTLRDKLHSFSETKFILFTGAVQVRANLPEDEAKRAKKFFDWVRDEWDLPEDNIFLWDLYQLETEGGLYLKDEYALSPRDSHPNKTFAMKASELLFQRIIDVIENEGKETDLTGTQD